MIERTLSKRIENRLFSGKAIILIGARQTGKTTLLQQLIAPLNDVLWLNADDLSVRDLFNEISVSKYHTMLGNSKTVVIDEAQRIVDIGLKAKIIVDNFTDIQLILTGSSSLELANKVNEPLTGRKWEYQLFPLSYGELASHFGTFKEMGNLNTRLVYGCYPEVVCNQGNEVEILKQLTDSYLYKDVLVWERIKKPDKIVKLLQALAYQIGSEVSLTELSNLIGLDKGTIDKYIYLLEQTQVIFRLSSFARNLRNELKMKNKIYFCDNGMRNALINNFSPIDMRNDVGALWENFIISERRKFNAYTTNYCNTYFWRTTQQQEIDYIEEKDGTLTAYEFKWNPKKKTAYSKTFLNAYPNSTVMTITPENYYEFLAN